MSSKDKRKFIRISSLNLSYVLVDGNQEDADRQTMGRTLNVSEAGIRLETNLPVEIGRQMMVSIGLEEELVDIRGRVVHSKQNDEGHYELGVEFLEKDAPTSDILKKFIKAFRAQRGLEE
jgi:c-di-GMP-binding flagellar brake protein YcgR